MNLQTEDFDWQGRVFLITEDEEVNFFYLKTLFKKTSAQILRAKNGQEAVDIISTNHQKIDLILMDINMPVMNGYEATKIIKSIHPDIPIVAQTAYSHSEDREKCLNAGFNDFIAKPIRKVILFNLVNGLLADNS
ncbi:MAG: response regulator [Bacteroidales bacterium]|nr:response regulator [Bacteroidales bacterium]MBN2697830.1 response regulator [Bacteroidales bacterium]